MILVVAVIVVLALLGTSYLAVARLDRVSSAAVRDSKNIDVAINASISRLQDVLRDDLVSSTGMFTGNIEPYDYPWTNSAIGTKDDTWLASFEPVSDTWGQISNINNVFLRMPSLAGTATTAESKVVSNPTPGSTVWQNNTNVPISSGGNMPLDYLSDPNYTMLGADADGDGILDSKWTWAGIRRIGDLEYVMAVRIVDESAKVNASVAFYNGGGTGQATAPRWWTPADLDIGRTFTSFTNTTAGSGTTTDVSSWLTYRYNTLSTATNFGFGTLSGTLGNPPNDLQRLVYWSDQGATYFAGTAGRSGASIVDTPELAHGGGLNRAGVASVIEQTVAAGFLRRDKAETSYTDVASTIADYFSLNPRLHLSHYSGTGYFANIPGAAKGMFQLDQMWQSDLAAREAARLSFRMMLNDFEDRSTTDAGLPFEAGASYIPVSPVETFSKTNPVRGYPTVIANQYVACLIDYFDKDRSPYTTPWNADNPGSYAVADEDSSVSVVAFQKANLLTPDYGTFGRLGMEALPFLTEVFVQGAYWPSMAPAWNTSNPLTTEQAVNRTITWTLQGNAGYMIEMVNPFSSPVRNLEHVRLRYSMDDGKTWRYAPSGGTTPAETDNLASIIGATGKQAAPHTAKQLAARTGLVLHRSANGAASGTILTQTGVTIPTGWRSINTGFALLEPAATYAVTPTHTPATTELIVELQVRIDPDVFPGYNTNMTGWGLPPWTTYSRLRKTKAEVASVHNEVLGLPQTVTAQQTFTADPTANLNGNNVRYIMRGTFCSTRGLNPIGVRCDVYTVNTGDVSSSHTGTTLYYGNDYVSVGTRVDDSVDFAPLPSDGTAAAASLPSTTLYASNSSTPFAQVGKAEKLRNNATVPLCTTFSSLALSDFDSLGYAFDDIRAMYVTDPLRVMWVGVSPPNKTWPQQPFTYGSNFVYLGVSTITGSVLNQRMLSFADKIGGKQPRVYPLMDRLTAIPRPFGSTSPILGRINVNTAPQRVLERALPLSDTTLRTSLASDIVTRRPNGALFPRLSGPGFASIGELFELTNIRAWSTDTNYTATSGGQLVAFDGGGFYQPTGIADDRSEEVRLAGFLSNVLSVRSDFYTAYVVVRGYPAGDWRLGSVESARFVVIFDRSNVTSVIDKPKILGMIRLE